MTTPLTVEQMKRLRVLVRNVKTAVTELDAYLQNVTNDKDDLDREAQDVLKTLLANGSIALTNLSLRVTKALSKNPNKDSLKAMILDEDWQFAQDWLRISKDGMLSIAKSRRTKGSTDE